MRFERVFARFEPLFARFERLFGRLFAWFEPLIARLRPLFARYERVGAVWMSVSVTTNLVSLHSISVHHMSIQITL